MIVSQYEKDMIAAVSTIIKMEMAGLGLRQQDVAESVGIHRETLSRYLGGKKEMPLGTLFLVAETLGTTGQDLITKAEKRIAR